MQLKKQLLKQGNFLFKNRSHLPIIIVLIAIVVFIFQPKNISANFYNKLMMLSLLVSIFGLLVRVFTIGFADNQTSGRNTKDGQVAESLNTNGIYSIFRHPLYIGNFLMWFGAALLTCNFWFIVAFVLFYFLYYERIIYAEENFLENKFKDQFESWLFLFCFFCSIVYLIISI